MNGLLKRLRSKTYWLGFATLILGALEAAQATGALPDLLDGPARGYLTIGVAVAIFILREMTSKPVKDK